LPFSRNISRASKASKRRDPS